VSETEEPPPLKFSERAGKALPEGVGAVVGVLAENATGSPVIGAAVAPFVATGIRFVRDWERQWYGRVGLTLFYAQEESPDLDIEAAIRADSARLELAARVVEAAGRTPLKTKMQALGTVLAWGLNPGGRVDEALLLAAALDELEVFHIRVLKVLSDANRRVDQGVRGWDTGEIVAALPELGVVAVSVLRTLERHDLVRVSSATWPSEHGFEYNGPFIVTAFGLLCLDLLREQAPER
jgi:hypothetical protein